MSECYQCEGPGPLIHQSRCAACIVARLKFNERENERLRGDLARARHAMAAATRALTSCPE